MPLDLVRSALPEEASGRVLMQVEVELLTSSPDDAHQVARVATTVTLQLDRAIFGNLPPDGKYVLWYCKPEEQKSTYHQKRKWLSVVVNRSHSEPEKDEHRDIVARGRYGVIYGNLLPGLSTGPM